MKARFCHICGFSLTVAARVKHLDVLDELLSRRVDGSLAVDDVLDAAGPAHRLVQQLAVETVGVFTAVHDHVPVAWSKQTNEWH